MPPGNAFRHQAYRPGLPSPPPVLLHPDPPPAPGTDAFQHRMRGVAAALRRAGVKAVYLVHGTFAGTDALGILRVLSRVTPAAAERLAQVQKRFVNAVTGDRGNYSAEYESTLFHGLNDGASFPEIPVRTLNWTGENHHAARADGAVRVIDALAEENAPASGRVLLWGHSHGGNVFALVTNLLASNRTVRDRFFRAARSLYRRPLSNRIDVPAWGRVQALLDCDDNPLEAISLDLATFGTPVRYGWDSRGYARLLHFVNHRPAAGLPEHRAAFPPSLEEVLTGGAGDTVQQLGIAGTNFAPSLVTWRTHQADQRLNRLLQPGLRARDLLIRLRPGVRTPEEGRTLLVDYGEAQGHVGLHLAGHAVYTRLDWMLFHAEEVARRFYGLEARE